MRTWAACAPRNRASPRGGNRLDVFVSGTDSALYHKAWNGVAWSPSVTGYEFMGGTIAAVREVVPAEAPVKEVSPVAALQQRDIQQSLVVN